MTDVGSTLPLAQPAPKNLLSPQWGADAFSSLFTLDVTTFSQKDCKLFSATYILCSKKFCNKKIEGSSL
jgi:hypothetical protein